MHRRPHPIRPTLALALALAAIAPATASARFDGPAEPAAEPTPQVIRVDTPSGFDWGDAGIGIAAGVGLSMVAVGGSLVVVGKHRHRAEAGPAPGVSA